MDERRIPPAGDPFTAKTVGEKPDEAVEAHYACLELLEERLRHELLDDEERQELRDRILRLRRRRQVP